MVPVGRLCNPRQTIPLRDLGLGYRLAGRRDVQSLSYLKRYPNCEQFAYVRAVAFLPLAICSRACCRDTYEEEQRRIRDLLVCSRTTNERIRRSIITFYNKTNVVLIFDLLIFLSMCSRLIKEAMQNVVYVREGKIENNSANNAQDVQVNQKTPIMK
ncbi:hypothetical protein J6590_020437, partial [Homalodisca vitripennis]